MSMAASIRHSIDRTFDLSEEDLLKLEELISSRLSAMPDFKREFNARRQDGMVSSFQSASELLAEDHVPRNPVVALGIAGTAEGTTVDLVFDVREPVQLHIDSTQRDAAYLLFADLRDYLRGEVIRRFGYQVRDSFVLKIIPMTVLLATATVLLGWRAKAHSDGAARLAVIQSSDIAAKLNFLLASQGQRTDTPDPMLLVGWMLACIVLPLITAPVGRWIFPDSVFYWGKVATKHDLRMERRNRIWWGVVIAFIIGIASTVATDYFKH